MRRFKIYKILLQESDLTFGKIRSSEWKLISIIIRVGVFASWSTPGQSTVRPAKLYRDPRNGKAEREDPSISVPAERRKPPTRVET